MTNLRARRLAYQPTWPEAFAVVLALTGPLVAWVMPPWAVGGWLVVMAGVLVVGERR